MIPRRRLARLAAACLPLAVVAILGCSKSTSPGGGGGGGGMKELDSAVLGSGQDFPHMFKTAGTFNYHCNIHGLAMSGVVTVGTGPATATVSITDNKYTPQNLTVGTNATVTWTNNGANNHTVTSN
jgi:plastocyanin